MRGGTRGSAEASLQREAWAAGAFSTVRACDLGPGLCCCVRRHTGYDYGEHSEGRPSAAESVSSRAR